MALRTGLANQGAFNFVNKSREKRGVYIAMILVIDLLSVKRWSVLVIVEEFLEKRNCALTVRVHDTRRLNVVANKHANIAKEGITHPTAIKDQTSKKALNHKPNKCW